MAFKSALVLVALGLIVMGTLTWMPLPAAHEEVPAAVVAEEISAGEEARAQIRPEALRQIDREGKEAVGQ